MKYAQLTENPKIPVHIDKAVSDNDLKAADALTYLTKKGYDEHILTKLLTVGNLGIKKQRKLVPTRWGITAVHSTIGNNICKEVKYNESDEYAAYFGSYLGNYYLMLTFPDIWQYVFFFAIFRDMQDELCKIPLLFHAPILSFLHRVRNSWRNAYFR